MNTNTEILIHYIKPDLNYHNKKQDKNFINIINSKANKLFYILYRTHQLGIQFPLDRFLFS